MDDNLGKLYERFKTIYETLGRLLAKLGHFVVFEEFGHLICGQIFRLVSNGWGTQTLVNIRLAETESLRLGSRD
jgi:hypothetical protein